MSQASKHIDWCLKKAQKEIEECKKQGNRVRHRGLIKIKPDIKKAEYHLQKARHDLEAVSYFKNGFSDWSVTASFYTMYQCLLAIAAKFGYESSNQTCTVALIENLRGINVSVEKINYEPIELEILKKQISSSIKEEK